MVDLETFGTRSSTMIVQIGACYFNRETGEIGDKFCLNVHHNTDDFTIDYSTIAWWLQQSEQARKSILENTIDIESAMHRLATFMQHGSYLWAHATFDLPIIQNAFEKFKIKNPVPYRGMRDIRTLMDIADHKSTSERDGVHHNALDDAIFQVKYCVEAMNKLKHV